MGHKSCQKTCSCMGSSLHEPQFCQESAPCARIPQSAASFRAHPPALEWGPPQAAVWISAPKWSSMGCRRTTCVTMVFSMGCRGISSMVPGILPPPPSSLTLVLAELLHIFPYSSPSHSIFYPFLTIFSMRHDHLGCWAQPCPAIDLLKPAGTVCASIGQPQPLLAETTPAAPHCQYLDPCTL